MRLQDRPSPSSVTGVLLPGASGIYVLVLRLAAAIVVQPGRLGTFSLPAGDYAYVGSACGPGGLRGRVARHLRGTGHHHWHIDALRTHATICAVLYTVTPLRMECTRSQALAQLPGAHTPIPGFGSSDCRAGCTAHMVALAPDTSIEQLRCCLGDAVDTRHQSQCKVEQLHIELESFQRLHVLGGDEAMPVRADVQE
jgi:Uri superfamily endonuclease